MNKPDMWIDEDNRIGVGSIGGTITTMYLCDGEWRIDPDGRDILIQWALAERALASSRKPG